MCFQLPEHLIHAYFSQLAMLVEHSELHINMLLPKSRKLALLYHKIFNRRYIKKLLGVQGTYYIQTDFFEM